MRLKIFLIAAFLSVTLKVSSQYYGTGDYEPRMLGSTGFVPGSRSISESNLRNQGWEYFGKIITYRKEAFSSSGVSKDYRDYRLYYKEVGRDAVLRVTDISGSLIYAVSHNRDYGNQNSEVGYFEYCFYDGTRWLYFNIQ